MNDEQPLSIAEYIELLNEQLKFYKAHITGEVTQVKIPASGHVYFTLKDKEKGAVLDCVMWKGMYALYGIRLEVGMEVIVSGQASIYPALGKLSFVTSAIALVGEGALKRAYEALKKKLTEEGLFSPERKRALPDFPRKIGVITSKQGAVIHDFMNNLGRHGFHITFIDSRVEGIEALPDLYNALRTMKTKDVEVIVLMRGGGSMQSFAAFDSEKLVREVASSPIPVITAIGHHQDVPLSTLASDISVSTPTAAATLLSSKWVSAAQQVWTLNHHIFSTYQTALSQVHHSLDLQRTEILGRFRRIIDSFSYIESQLPLYVRQVSRSISYLTEKLERNSQKIAKGMEQSITQSQEKINNIERLVNIYNPLRQLSLGYSLIQNSQHRLVKSIKDVTIGERVRLITQDGVILSAVEHTEEKQDE